MSPSDRTVPRGPQVVQVGCSPVRVPLSRCGGRKASLVESEHLRKSRCGGKGRNQMRRGLVLPPTVSAAWTCCLMSQHLSLLTCGMEVIVALQGGSRMLEGAGG